MEGLEYFYEPSDQNEVEERVTDGQNPSFWIDTTPDKMNEDMDKEEEYEEVSNDESEEYGGDQMEVESEEDSSSIIDLLSSDSDEEELDGVDLSESESSDLPEPTFLLHRPDFNFQPEYGVCPNLDFENPRKKGWAVRKVNKSRSVVKL